MTTEAQAELNPDLGMRPRVLSALSLLAIAIIAALVGHELFRAFTDAWVAPIQLSPDSDPVIQTRASIQRQVAERDRLAAELERIDGELAGIATTLTRLRELARQSAGALRWGHESTGDELRDVEAQIRRLRADLPIHDRMVETARDLLERARADHAAGLITAGALQREVQALDQRTVARARLRRELSMARAQRDVLRQRVEAFEAGANGDPNAPILPEVAASGEQSIRVALETITLENEQRHLQNLRRIAERHLAEIESILEQIRSRPIYLASQSATDIAFVPYDQLEDVVPGAEIVNCLGGFVVCRRAGEVHDVLPGEVVTEGPWGERTRGRYAILALDDADAVFERTLRVRGS